MSYSTVGSASATAKFGNPVWEKLYKCGKRSTAALSNRVCKFGIPISDGEFSPLTDKKLCCHRDDEVIYLIPTAGEFLETGSGTHVFEAAPQTAPLHYRLLWLQSGSDNQGLSESTETSPTSIDQDSSTFIHS